MASRRRNERARGLEDWRAFGAWKDSGLIPRQVNVESLSLNGGTGAHKAGVCQLDWLRRGAWL
ncbi:hypothetical protein F2Q69_00046299 [Brassica cretica]|uniref:Uncharacterized protein n=1 Tax=Brassica cretica TaxID=69181 RepID=A0A8S9PS16_BRACR|nr:hypothetical protein F2Q69_00046299 [Brassica cretica]